jgi:acyl-CoA reductase-like NAD-dependent aldehyde dehydrogenase
VCIGIKRIYIHEKVYDAVRDALVEYAKTVKVGDPVDPSNEIGPVQNRMQFEKIKYISSRSFVSLAAEVASHLLLGHSSTIVIRRDTDLRWEAR